MNEFNIYINLKKISIHFNHSERKKNKRNIIKPSEQFGIKVGL